MGTFRVWARLILFSVMTFVMVMPRLAILGLEPVAPRLERRLRRPIIRLWARLLARIVGMHIRVAGNPPKPPFMLVANHTGYMDSFLLAAVTGAVFVAREDIQRWPGAGIVAKVGNTVFIDRSDKRDVPRVNAIVRHELDRGAGIVVYPEARTSSGHQVRPFKSGLLEPAVAAGFPIHYCTLHFETFPGDPPPSEVVSWHTDIKFADHLKRLLALRGFNATVTFGPEPLRLPDRKQLAQALHESVLSQFRPLE